MSRTRIYALLLILGAGFLFYRTAYLSIEGYLVYWIWWVAALLVAEMLVDLACMLSSVRWFWLNDPTRDKLPLRLGTAAALVHALRVLIYALGRTGPINFDTKPEYHYLYDDHNMSWVWFASIMSVLGILGVLVIWRIRIRNRRRSG
jgi:hypothetical protein